MRTHGRIEWDAPPAVVADNLTIGPASTLTSRRIMLPRSVEPLTARDEALFLLHLAAEIEHSLLIQYLYAAYSLPSDAAANILNWRDSIKRIATQEMGHLITVQNLLLSLGGAITMDREEFPYRSDFYPFPFCLEPLTRDSLAKYVSAEAPMPEIIATLPEAIKTIAIEAQVRAQRIDGVGEINRVGALYAKIGKLIRDQLTDADFQLHTVNTFQARPDDLGGEGPTSPTPMASIPVWPIDSASRAAEAIDLIADQGEGTTSCDAESHFIQFLEIYREFPETNPRYGLVDPDCAPSLPVPTNPHTSPVAAVQVDLGAINDPLALQIALYSNLRYRLILDLLGHFLITDRSVFANCKSYLAAWALGSMSTLPALYDCLTELPSQSPPVYVERKRVCGSTPFEMPFSLAVSPDRVSRWGNHVDVLKALLDLAAEIVADPAATQEQRDMLGNFSTLDDRRLREIEDEILPAIQGTNDDCPFG